MSHENNANKLGFLSLYLSVFIKSFVWMLFSFQTGRLQSRKQLMGKIYDNGHHDDDDDDDVKMNIFSCTTHITVLFKTSTNV